MKLRKVRIGLLGLSGVVYRLHVIAIQTLFFYIITGKLKWAIGTSVIWNVINTGLYYNYHYWFARFFKLGKEEKKEEI